MSVTTAKAGLKARLQTLVTAGTLKVVLNGQPSTAHNLPLAYMELDSGRRVQRGQVTYNEYRIAVHALVAHQENVAAEDQLDALVNAIAASIDDAPTLPSGASNTVNFATGAEWTADYFTLAEVLTRRLTWFVLVKDTGTYGGTI